MHGQFIWYELTTPDVAGTKKFYPRFTGWGTQAFDKDYTMFTTGGMPIAGIFRLTDDMKKQGIPPNWMPYVESSDVDETTQLATSLGGRVMHGPQDVPGAGRFAVVSDPQGAVFGVYKSTSPQGAWDGTAVAGRFSWHELMTTDRVAAYDFYSKLFGWEKNGEMDMGGGEMYVMWGHGQKMYGGMYNRMPDMAGMRPFWLVYITVKDVAAAVAAATKAGAAVIRPQMDIPGGAIAILSDPQGAGFALHHVNPTAAEKPAAKAPATSSASTPSKKAAKAPARTAAKAPKKAAKPAKKAAKAAATKAAKPAKKAAKAAKKAAKPAARKVVKAAARKSAKVARKKAARPATRKAAASSKRKPVKAKATKSATRIRRRGKPKARKTAKRLKR